MTVQELIEGLNRVAVCRERLARGESPTEPVNGEGLRDEEKFDHLFRLMSELAPPCRALLAAMFRSGVVVCTMGETRLDVDVPDGAAPPLVLVCAPAGDE
jgi:hypothetical protein